MTTGVSHLRDFIVETQPSIDGGFNVVSTAAADVDGGLTSC